MTPIELGAAGRKLATELYAQYGTDNTYSTRLSSFLDRYDARLSAGATITPTEMENAALRSARFVYDSLSALYGSEADDGSSRSVKLRTLRELIVGFENLTTSMPDVSLTPEDTDETMVFKVATTATTILDFSKGHRFYVRVRNHTAIQFINTDAGRDIDIILVQEAGAWNIAMPSSEGLLWPDGTVVNPMPKAGQITEYMVDTLTDFLLVRHVAEYATAGDVVPVDPVDPPVEGFLSGVNLFASIPDLNLGVLPLELVDGASHYQTRLTTTTEAYADNNVVSFADAVAAVGDFIVLDGTLEVQLATSKGLLIARTAILDAVSSFSEPAFATHTTTVPFVIDNPTGDDYFAELTITVEGTGPVANTLGEQLPSWAQYVGTVPNGFTRPSQYTTLGGLARSVSQTPPTFQSENLTKALTVVQALDGDNLPIVDFSQHDELIGHLEAVLGPVDEWIHGLYGWWNSPSAVIEARLAASPESWIPLLQALMQRANAQKPNAKSDWNEPFLSFEQADYNNDYIRGPKDTTAGYAGRGGVGNAYVQAALASGYAHGPRPWLEAFKEAERLGIPLVMRDFGDNSGAPLGHGFSLPTGYTDTALSTQKSDRARQGTVLDEIQYAGLHGARIKEFQGQYHLNTHNLIEERMAYLYHTGLSHMGTEYGVTEIDVKCSGVPIGEAEDSGSDAAYNFAEAYVERSLTSALAYTGMSLIAGWSDYDNGDDGTAPRIAAFDRQGITSLGRGIVSAFNNAQAPDARNFGPISRAHFLTDPRRANMRSFTNPSAGGFNVQPNNQGGTTNNGTGGVVFRLHNTGIVPDGPTASWYDNDGVVTDYSLDQRSILLQYKEGNADGYRLSILDASDAFIGSVQRSGNNLVLTNGTDTVTIGSVNNSTNNCIMIRWIDGVMTGSANGGAVGSIPMTGTPDRGLLMGNKVAGETSTKTQLLIDYLEPADDATLMSLSIFEPAHMPSASQITMGTNHYVPSTFTVQAPSLAFPANATLVNDQAEFDNAIAADDQVIGLATDGVYNLPTNIAGLPTSLAIHGTEGTILRATGDIQGTNAALDLELHGVGLTDQITFDATYNSLLVDGVKAVGARSGVIGTGAYDEILRATIDLTGLSDEPLVGDAIVNNDVAASSTITKVFRYDSGAGTATVALNDVPSKSTGGGKEGNLWQTGHSVSIGASGTGITASPLTGGDPLITRCLNFSNNNVANQVTIRNSDFNGFSQVIGVCAANSVVVNNCTFFGNTEDAIKVFFLEAHPAMTCDIIGNISSGILINETYWLNPHGDFVQFQPQVVNTSTLFTGLVRIWNNIATTRGPRPDAYYQSLIIHQHSHDNLDVQCNLFDTGNGVRGVSAAPSSGVFRYNTVVSSDSGTNTGGLRVGAVTFDVAAGSVFENNISEDFRTVAFDASNYELGKWGGNSNQEYATLFGAAKITDTGNPVADLLSWLSTSADAGAVTSSGELRMPNAA